VGCGHCGAPLGDGDLFCGDCGAPAGGGCPTCGEPLTPGMRFCRRCGATLFDPAHASAAAAPAPVSPSAREPGAERRVCSVLFCDVVGFTPLSESRDPEAVRELLAPMLRAERDLLRARLLDGDAAASFAAAIKSLREQSTPYHLAHGLLDHAEYLLASSDAQAAAAAIEEARDLAGRLRCQPLMDQAATLTSPHVAS